MSSSITEPLITIAIPTYNSAERYLPLAIRSALAQTYGNLEIIVSDNGSTDNTSDVVKGFDDSRIRYIRHEKSLGPDGNFNFCLNEAKGTYTLLLHDDDLIDADYIATCMTSAGFSSDHSFVRTGTRIIDGEGNVLRENRNVVEGRSPEALYRAWFNNMTEVYYCSTLFNTSALREVGGFRSPFNQLQDGYAIAMLAPKRDWVDVQAVKASFRKSPGQLTYSVPVKEWCGDFAGLLDIMSEQIDGNVEEFRERGKQFFGRLARDRAQKRATRFGRMRAGITVARHFGPQYFPWGRLRALGRPFLQKAAPTAS